MDNSYLQDRIHEILEGKIAMGGYRRKSRSKSRKRMSRGGNKRNKMAAKQNPWLKHVRAVRREVGMDVPYKEVLMMASDSYCGGVKAGGVKAGVLLGGGRKRTRYQNSKCTKYSKKKRPIYYKSPKTGKCYNYSRHQATLNKKPRKVKKGSKKRKVTKTKGRKRGKNGRFIKGRGYYGGCEGEVCAYPDMTAYERDIIY